jgi:hypothetical protein
MKKKTNKYTIGKFDLRVGRGVSGKGLFAKSQITKGSCIIEYTGKEIKKADQEKTRGKYLFWTSKDKMINGNVSSNLARYINHSCKPNCEATGPNGHVYIMSLKKIEVDEELTFNYGKEYFNEYIKPKGCRCTKCKK